MIVDTGLGLMLAAVLLWILVAALLSPLETLGWWAGWFSSQYENGGSSEASPDKGADRQGEGEAAYYVAFLTGISGADEEVHMPQERAFLRLLESELPEARVISDIFPYSVTNRALTGQRVFAWLWRYALRKKEEGSPAGFLINGRNLFQVLISADHRYGPMYNQGGAQIILSALRRHGYPFQSGKPLFLLGLSGGGQICLGAAPYLKEVLRAPIIVISLAGVMCSDPGLMAVEHLYHLRGSKDRVPAIGTVIFPGRWRFMQNSYWNRCRQRGKITLIDMGPMVHTRTGSYLDSDSRLPDGSSYLEKTVRTIRDIIQMETR